MAAAIITGTPADIRAEFTEVSLSVSAATVHQLAWVQFTSKGMAKFTAASKITSVSDIPVKQTMVTFVASKKRVRSSVTRVHCSSQTFS